MSELQLNDKVCIVTGAGKGIGRAVAELFYAQGATLALFSRDGDDLKALQDELRATDDRFFSYAGDVGDEAAVTGFVSAAIDRFKSVDILINNAGMRFRKPFLETSTAEWTQVLNNNLNSVYYFCREAGRRMVARKQGRIVNIASIIGTLGLPELAVYGASKGAVITLTKCLALEWAEHGVNVNAIAPGFVETSYTENFKKKTELYQFTLDRTPQKKWGGPMDVANACLFLASEAANFITGETLNVDGGWSAW